MGRDNFEKFRRGERVRKKERAAAFFPKLHARDYIDGGSWIDGTNV